MSGPDTCRPALTAEDRMQLAVDAGIDVTISAAYLAELTERIAALEAELEQLRAGATFVCVEPCTMCQQLT